MSGRVTVWVERVDGKIVRVLRSTHSANFRRAMEAGTLETCPRRDAVTSIWEALWERACGYCEYQCGRRITRSGFAKGEMHEEVHRSLGGEISLENSKMICKTCHRKVAHGDRKPQWSKPFDLEE